MHIDRSHASPNHGDRLAAVDMLVLHYTGMKSEDGAIRWLCNPEAQVSAHYVIREDGRIHQLVDESRRAWHAGRSFWRGITDINSHSIGIEICNPGHEFGYRPFPPAQIAATIALCGAILSRHAIPPANVVAHSDIAPTRKEDPGELFPFDLLAENGIGLWLAPAPLEAGPALGPGNTGPDVSALQQSLADIGYGLPVTGLCDDLTSAVITAFQRRFRQQKVDGLADVSTIRTVDQIRNLLSSNLA